MNDSLPSYVKISYEDFIKLKVDEKVLLSCCKCDKLFADIKNNVKIRMLKGHKAYCSRTCGFKGLIKSVQKNCTYCNKPISVSPSRLKNVKHAFCSSSCSATYYNLIPGRKRFAGKRSKAELYLANLIKTKYPHLTIIECSRTLLTCGYEIDIFIKDINFAIEINGPSHYIPIFGDKMLTQIQHRDTKKMQEIHERKYHFMVLNISQFNYHKRVIKFLDDIFKTEISDIIDKLLNLEANRDNASQPSS